jgi:hypothetical protein
MALPTIVTALGMGAIEAWRFREPGSPLFVTPFAYSLADAIAEDDLPRAYAFIRAGQNPNDPIAASHPVLTEGRQVLVSPLLWAVAAQKSNAVLMLLGYGARLDGVTGDRAVCLAERLGDTKIAGALRRFGGHRTAAAPCQPQTARGAPLLDMLEK